MITPDKVRVYVACARKDGKKEKLRLWYNGSYLTPVDGDIWVVPAPGHIYHVTRIEADEFTHTVTDVRIIDADGYKRWDMRLPKYQRDWLPVVAGISHEPLPKGINMRDFLSASAKERAHNFIRSHQNWDEFRGRDINSFTDDELRNVLSTMREIYN